MVALRGRSGGLRTPWAWLVLLCLLLGAGLGQAQRLGGVDPCDTACPCEEAKAAEHALGHHEAEDGAVADDAHGEGYFITLAGQFQNLEQARARLLVVVPLALLLVFSLLYLTYGRASDALRIFSGVPFGAVSGVFALWFWDMPFSISAGVGAEVQRPLATVVVGGMITSTIATLLVLPVLYSLFGGQPSPHRD